MSLWHKITLVVTFVDICFSLPRSRLDPSLPLLKSGHEKLQARVLVNLFSMQQSAKVAGCSRFAAVWTSLKAAGDITTSVNNSNCFRPIVQTSDKLKKISPSGLFSPKGFDFILFAFLCPTTSLCQCDQIGQFIGLWASF